MERLLRWGEISHWDVRDACRLGELRVLCAGPSCNRVCAVTGGMYPGLAPLWVLAPRMRCIGCGHRGAQFEVWGSRSAAKFAERHVPAPPARRR